MLRDSGIPYCILQPTFFMTNFARLSLPQVRLMGSFTGACGRGKVSSIHPDDIAEVAAEVLCNSGAHIGRTYPLTGGAAIDQYECAALASELSGRDIQYVDMSEAELVSMLTDKAGLPYELAAGVGKGQTLARNGAYESISPCVEQLLGKKPRTWEHYLDSIRDEMRQ